MTTEDIDLRALALEWSVRLQTCQYAGEVALSDESLPKIAAAVRRDLFSPRRSTDTSICLLVLAVNCMYYRHDERGFWIHYCDLMDVPNTPETEAWLGSQLEAVLLSLGLQEEVRPGPFRYVSPLREQCGITRSEIRRYADLLAKLAGQYGWDGLQVIDARIVQESVSAALQEGHLSRFLQEEQGLALTRDVARSVSQYRRGVISLEDLKILPGYRSRFFDELFAALGRSPERASPSPPRPPLPRLIFLPDIKQVALVFDQDKVYEGCYRLGNALVRQTPVLFALPNQFGESVSGQRRESGGRWSNWTIPGWAPARRRLALFDTERGYWPLTRKITPGRYYMLAPSSAPPPDAVTVVSYGMIDLPFRELDYDAWLIEITPHSDLRFLGVEPEPRGHTGKLITWDPNVSRLPGSYGLDDVFVATLPDIVLVLPELFSSGTVGLFFQCGNEAKRIRVGAGARRICLNVQPGQRGRVWVEPISRTRDFAGLDTLDELSFQLLPACRIKWPEGLFNDAAEPEVELISRDAGLTLHLENATPTGSTGTSRCLWRVGPGVTFVRGYIRYRDLEVTIGRRIFRALLTLEENSRTPFITREDLRGPQGVLAQGAPGDSAEIAITNGQVELPLASPGTFNEAGECRFTTFAIRDVLANYRSPLGQFLLEASGARVKTATYFLDCDVLIEWLEEDERKGDAAWRTILPPPLERALAFLLEARDVPVRQVPGGAADTFLPDPLRRYVASVTACAAILDGALLGDQPTMAGPDIIAAIEKTIPEQAKFLSWFCRANGFARGQDSGERTGSQQFLDEHSRLEWSPPFRRWRSMVDELLRHLHDDLEVRPLLEEWCKDVERGYQATYRSAISSQLHGRDVTEAWIRYRAGNLPSAVAAVSRLIALAASPVSDLAAILLRIAWMRMAHFASQPALEVNSSNARLAAVHADLVQILALCGRERPHAYLPKVAELAHLLPVLPLAAPDRSALSAFVAPPGVSTSQSDWLAAYFLFLISVHSGDAEKARVLARALEVLSSRIPASPDKPTIVDFMERYL